MCLMDELRPKNRQAAAATSDGCVLNISEHLVEQFMCSMYRVRPAVGGNADLDAQFFSSDFLKERTHIY